MAIYGYPEDDWKAARREAKKILAKYAKNGALISYSALADKIKTACFEASSPSFWALLGDISTREFRKGRGMLTVLVVHKTGDKKPGKDFFTLARSLGIRGDEVKIWIDQFNFVVDHWKQQ